MSYQWIWLGGQSVVCAAGFMVDQFFAELFDVNSVVCGLGLVVNQLSVELA